MKNYRVITEQLIIAGENFHIRRIANVDEVLDELLSKDPDHDDVKDERIPYWADLWPSAIAMAEYLLLNRNLLKGAVVLEIGCGLGLPGIVAGKSGAAVTLTDYLPEPLDFAKQNWELNNNKIPVAFRQLDWRYPDSSMAADVVIASDVAYEKRSFDDLMNAFKVLCKPGGVLLWSEPNRELAKPFYQMLNENGFIYETNTFSVPYNSLITKVNVCKIRMENSRIKNQG